MFYPLFVLIIFLSLVFTIHGQDCNICGDGNSIQYGQGVIEFMFNGKKWKNNCIEIQKSVQNVNAISDEFCRTELLQYTKDVCRCTTPEGDLISDLPTPTTAPTPSSVFVKIPTASGTIEAPTSSDTTVKVKCEQESGSNKNCTEEENDNTSSALVNKLFLDGTVWTIFGAIAIFIAL
jgi:hypothetical protein